MAEEGGERGRNDRPLRRRFRHGVSGAGGSRTIPGGVAGTTAEVRPGATSGKDPADRVRAEVGKRLEVERGRQTRDVRFSGIHPQLWAKPEGLFPPTPRDSGQANAGEAASSQTATPDSAACTGSGNREVAEIGRTGLLQLPCDTGQ